MPLRVTCPSCSTSLKAPDSAAGKALKCPKCQAGISVTPAPALPRAARACRVRDDDPPPRPPAEEYEVIDDEPEPRRPRRKRRREKEEELPGWVKAACWVVAIFMVFVVPAARVLRFHMAVDAIEERAMEREAQKKEAAKAVAGLTNSRNSSPPGGFGTAFRDAAMATPTPTPTPTPIDLAPQKPPTTTEWTRFDGPDGLFTAYFPPGCESATPELRGTPTSTKPSLQTWSQHAQSRLYTINLNSYAPHSALMGDPNFVAQYKGRDGSYRPTTLSGHQARLSLRHPPRFGVGAPHTLVEYAVGLGDGNVVDFHVLGSDDISFEDPLVKEFFDRIVIPATPPDADAR